MCTCRSTARRSSRASSLKIEDGEVVALIGGSGEGKSVLLKCMAGLLQPNRGKVYIDGRDITRLGREKLKKLRERFGFLFQSGALFGSMTVYENVAFPLREKTKLSEDEIRAKVLGELEQVGLGGAEEKYPSQLSGGMVKRAALARALVQAPEIMFFDEPTTGLDPLTANSIHELIDSCHKQVQLQRRHRDARDPGRSFRWSRRWRCCTRAGYASSGRPRR